MKNFPQIFRDVERLTADEHKPLSAMVSQLFQEGGELAEAASITEGHIRHKVLSEPLVGEVADVCQVAISISILILIRATPELSPEQRLDLFLSHFERKNAKWEAVQVRDKFDANNDRAIAGIEMSDDYSMADEDVHPAEIEQMLDSDEHDTRAFSARFEKLRPAGGSHDIGKRAITTVGQQLGVAFQDIKLDHNFVEDLGADSLDLVELAMAIEDEFEMEISDRDAELIQTPREIIHYVQKRFGIGVDPAADYTDSTGRYLSLSERMQERSLHNLKIKKDIF